MNEDGNNFAPQGPIFSSPDTPPANPNPAPAPQAPVTPAPAPTPAPEQPTYTNPFATSEAPTEPAAPAAPIMSTPQEPANNTRHMFNSRRFKDTQAQAAPTQFAGAPDFFNQAAAQNAPSTGDIVIGDQPQRSGGKGKMIAVVAAILLLIGGGVGAYFVTQGGPAIGGASGNSSNGDSGQEQPKGAKETITALYNNYLSLNSDYYYISDNPSQRIADITDGGGFAVGDKDFFSRIQSDINVVKGNIESLNNIPEKERNESIKTIIDLVPSINESMEIIEKNIQVLEKFYSAFTEPLYSYLATDKKESSCVISDSAKDLLKDEKLLNAANSYKEAFCEIYLNKPASKKELNKKNYPNIEKAEIALVQTMMPNEKNATIVNAIGDAVEEYE